MICPYCGTQNTDNVNFCNMCGSRLITESFNVQQPYYQQPYTGKRSLKGTPGRGFGISSMVLGIIAVYYAFMYWITCTTSAFKSGNSPAGFVSLSFFILILSTLSLIFAFLARGKGYKHQSTAGLVLSICSFVLTFLSIMIILIL